MQTNGNAVVLGDNNRPIQHPRQGQRHCDQPAAATSLADGVRVGRLRLAGLSPADQPVKMGDNQFRSRGFAPGLGRAPTVRQGFLEASNVNVVKEMVSMISIMRAYETNQKMLQAEDDATGKATNEVSKL